MLLWGCSPVASGAPHLLQPCHPPGHASLRSGMHRARLWEGGRRGSLPCPWCQLPSQPPPLLSGLASLKGAQVATPAVGIAARLSCARLPCLLSPAKRGEGEREGRQRHDLKALARARHGGRGNHRQRGAGLYHLRFCPELQTQFWERQENHECHVCNPVVDFCSAPGVAPVWVGSGCFPVPSPLLFSEDDLMRCGMEKGFAHLLCCCPAFISLLSSHSSLFLFKALGVPHLCVEWVTAESAWQLMRETSGAVMSLGSWIPSL